MKLGLTYLLILYLSFFKGHSCVLHEEHKKPCRNSYTQNIQNNNFSGLLNTPDGGGLSDDLFCIDDDDDNVDPVSSRKPGSFSSSCIANNIILSISYLSQPLKNDQKPLKAFFYSHDKNILFRVMKL